MLSDNQLFCRMILVWIWLHWAVAAGQSQHRNNVGRVCLVHPVIATQSELVSSTTGIHVIVKRTAA